MSRSLSWFDPQELDALFSQIGVSEKGAGASKGAPPPPAKTASYERHTHSLGALVQSDDDAPFNRRALQFTQRQRAIPQGAPKAPPARKPIGEPGPAALQQAVRTWKEAGQLPALLANSTYPGCYGAFLRWLLVAAEASAGFLADEQGLPLASQGADDLAAALSASFGQTKFLFELMENTADNPFNQVQIPLKTGLTWHLGWSSTNKGTLTWGLQRKEPIPVALTTSISSMLNAVLDHSANHTVSHRS